MHGPPWDFGWAAGGEGREVWRIGEREERGGRRGGGGGEGRCGGESQERGWEGDREQMGSEVRARRAAVVVSF